MATQQIDRATFLTRLRESGLLDGERLAEAESVAAASERAKTVARALVERGLLTRFQAEMIYRGRTDGFILGQYRVLDQIGRGGMGRVFKAEHMTMHRVVALKVLAADLMKTERAKQLFQREVRAAARLVHPHIVTAYDANESGDRHYLVMEYVDGPNLQELVKERGPLPIGQACEFIRQAALGLQYAHELGMVHRDLKPANLLVHRGSGAGFVVKILDFGLARLNEPAIDEIKGHDSLPGAEQQVMGTPDFLSPEQARNLHAADIRSDLYSLGCTLYYLLAGKAPFAGGTPLDKLVRHGTEQARPVHEIREAVPPGVSAIVARLMAKKPGDRFQTPLELAQALAPFADLGSDHFTPLGAAAANGPTSGQSPWAEIFDDEPNAQHSTLPADMSITPMHSTGRIKRATQMRIGAPSQPLPARPAWLKPTVIIGAAILGFLLGAVSLFLLR